MINWANSSYFFRSSKRAQLQQKYDNVSSCAKRLLIAWHVTLCFLQTLSLSVFDIKHNICLILHLQNVFWCRDLHTINQSASCRMPLKSPSLAPPAQSCESCTTTLESIVISHNKKIALKFNFYSSRSNSMFWSVMRAIESLK